MDGWHFDIAIVGAGLHGARLNPHHAETGTG